MKWSYKTLYGVLDKPVEPKHFTRLEILFDKAAKELTEKEGGDWELVSHSVVQLNEPSGGELVVSMVFRSPTL